MGIPCSQWRECGYIGGGCCAAGHYNGPSYGVCLQLCPHYDGPARGRGDLLKTLISTVTLGTVQPCGGCQERRADMNQAHPAGWVKETLNDGAR